MIGRLIALVSLAIVTIKAIVMANMQLMWLILTPWRRRYPQVFVYQSELQHDLALVCLTHIITLTPGTLVLDIDQTRRRVLIHHIDAPDVQSEREAIWYLFEQRLARVFLC